MGIFTVATLKKIWIFLCGALLILAAFLVCQYLFFCEQTHELQLLQEHYQEHIDVLKRVIADMLVVPETKPIESHVVKKKQKKKKQLYRSLHSYLEQKDSNIDVHDLQELYRSFDQPPPEIKNDEKEVIVPATHEDTVVRVQTVPSQVMSSKKSASKKRVLSWPIERDHFWMSSFFGRRKIARGKWTFHTGLDMAAIKGTPVHAAADGRVIESGDSNNGYGNMILLSHANGYKTRYAHLDRVRVRYGHSVKRGQVIGTVGDTGNVRGNGTDASHLHFEVYRYTKPVNPLYYLA
jgi:murein DD-endopeptidase MepM/ murein hydrolase activator NlpD